MISIAFVINIIATLICVGITCFLQVVMYPMLKHIGAERFPAFYESYRLKMTTLSFPIMSLEAFTSIVVLLSYTFRQNITPQMQRSFTVYGISVFLLLIIHLATFQAIQPLLKRLSKNFDPKTCDQIVRWNIIRTAGWSLRAILILSTMLFIG